MGSVLMFTKYLSPKSRAINIGVFKGQHRNDSHQIDFGTFQMAERNAVGIVKNVYVCMCPVVPCHNV